MNKIKFCGMILFFILCITCLVIFFSLLKHSFYPSYTFFSPFPPAENGIISVFFCPQDNCEEQLLFHLNQSTISIDCAFYDLNLPSVIELLQEKKEEGVAVRVVSDFDNKNAISHLSFVHFDTRSAYMHDKVCIFDGKEIMTGSMNPTISDATQNNNNILFLSSKILAKNYEEEFLSLWNGNFGADKRVKVSRLSFNNNTIENYFCPEDHCEEHILEVLATANTSIHFMTFSFTSDKIGDLLIEKGTSANPIEISGIMEKAQNNAYSEYKRLHQVFNVSWDANPNFLHHKVFIIDHAIVITGSMNPTKNGNEKNDENILIIHDPKIAQLYEEEFNRIKQQVNDNS